MSEKNTNTGITVTTSTAVEKTPELKKKLSNMLKHPDVSQTVGLAKLASAAKLPTIDESDSVEMTHASGVRVRVSGERLAREALRARRNMSQRLAEGEFFAALEASFIDVESADEVAANVEGGIPE